VEGRAQDEDEEVLNEKKIKQESSRENHLSPALDLNTFFISLLYLFFIPHLPASAIGNDF